MIIQCGQATSGPCWTSDGSVTRAVGCRVGSRRSCGLGVRAAESAENPPVQRSPGGREDRKRRQKRKSGDSEKRPRRTVREKLGERWRERPRMPEKSSLRTAKVQDDKLCPLKCQGAGSFEAVLHRESLGGRDPSMRRIRGPLSWDSARVKSPGSL